MLAILVLIKSLCNWGISFQHFFIATRGFSLRIPHDVYFFFLFLYMTLLLQMAVFWVGGVGWGGVGWGGDVVSVSMKYSAFLLSRKIIIIK